MAKIYLDDIRREAIANGWELLAEKYYNLKTDMKMRCPVGHEVYIPFGKWRQKHECPLCNQKANAVNLPQIIPQKTRGVRRVLALDDATGITGWSLYDGINLIGYGKINMGQDESIARIVGLRQWLISVMKQWEPDFVGLEDIQLQTYNNKSGVPCQQVKTFKTLAQLQGTLLATLFEAKVQCTLVSCNTWRSALHFTSKTRTDQKREAQLKIRNWYGLNVTSDEADSICIGKYLTEKYMRNNYIIEWGNE